MVTMGPLATKIGELQAEVAELESRLLETRNSNRRKLRSSEVAQIRLLAADGMRRKDLADLFHVNPATITRIVNNQYHKGA